MNSHDYRTLFEHFADYRTPDGTIVRAVWTGTRLNANPRAPHYWILAPDHSQAHAVTDFWQYEVEADGVIIVRYVVDATIADFPGWLKIDIFALLEHLSLGVVEFGMTDLTIDDFTKVEST